jgi:hypothetical protein
MRSAGGRWWMSMPALGALILLTGCSTGDRLRPGGPSSVAFCARMIGQFGKSRPGYVNAEEWGAKNWWTYSSLFDLDHDGKVTFAELAAKLGAPGSRPTTPLIRQRNAERSAQIAYDGAYGEFKRMDHGRKGYIDERDIMLGDLSDFRAHDLNRDGWLSPQECAVHLPHVI